MDNETFWQLIEETRRLAGRDGRKQAQLLTEKLVQLGVNEILSFDHIHCGYFDRAYDCDLWDAAYCIESCGDDSFMDFRAWLIAQGRATYERVLADPASLIDIVEVGQDTQVEDLLYITQYAYEQVTGSDELPSIVVVHPELKGKFADKIEDKYPELYAKFNDHGGED